MLILCKPISGKSSFTCLQLVSAELINIICVAFHTNPIGGHLNAYRTLQHQMYAYVKRMWHVSGLSWLCAGQSLPWHII
jgi:hypothetical protein